MQLYIYQKRHVVYMYVVMYMYVANTDHIEGLKTGAVLSTVLDGERRHPVVCARVALCLHSRDEL